MTDKLDAATIRELLARIDKAIDRITSGHAAMRVPVDLTDPDIVLSECAKVLQSQAAELERLREDNQNLRDRLYHEQHEKDHSTN